MPVRGRFGPLVGAIDEGTSSARFLVFSARTAEVLTYHQIHIAQDCPREGWVEQDPVAILSAVKECINETVENLKKLDIDPADIVAIGITNQRETTIVWDPKSGKPLYNAIVWLDVRNTETVDDLLKNVRDRNQDYFKPLCGLPVSTYFSALKLKWMMDNVPEVREAVKNKSCLFGTVDTWLIWNLTGGPNGGLHITDVTNASRTMLMNIRTLQWDNTLCKFFGIPKEILPEIRSSSEIYGYVAASPLEGVPISGCLGDQQSALVGQMCLHQGQAKNTYGTGCFLLYNTGTAVVHSSHGLLTTVAYRMGKNTPPVYALEGAIAIAGVAFSWLKDNIGILKDIAESENMIKEMTAHREVYFVPAFSGLYAPYWRKDARSVICGLSEETTKADIVKAAMEAVCFQTRDILNAMNKDCGIPLTRLLVDGGLTVNDTIMQLQADLCGIPVVRPLMTEATALGAAIAAGSAEGIEVWDLHEVQSVPSDVFKPSISEDERDMRYSRWKMAIERSLNWEPEAVEKEIDKEHCIRSSIPVGLFVVSAFCLLLIARQLKK
ncbi:glycerol kinase-like [Schistocerca piceifrons]|uniref:glycerol kinase-like n=1 Tax=Schistocerca piceifrons TaxID=274613 RepID=UPI001F5F07CB|nr:glycerol kinase-like [Schistocerca piceifrons]XP_047114215.1 glycerol kinase-like [Schistocerca piceifrons]XP_047114216.1 glycerol kinase-like [Schistocerca piceifrons]XP_047114217.1 glycerol kinase-like [Schistocerca piceifrons]